MTTVSSGVLPSNAVDDYANRMLHMAQQQSSMSCPPDVAPPHHFGSLVGIGGDVAGDGASAVWRQYERFLRRQGDRPATIALYHTALKDLWAHLDEHGIAWDRLTPEDVEAWLEEGRCEPGKWNAGMPWSDGTRYTYGRVVARAYRLFAERGWIQGRNPLEDWKPPPAPPDRPRALPVAAIGDLFVQLVDPRLRMMALLEYLQGLRSGEIAKLRVEDVRLHTDPPHLFVHGKGGKKQYMVLNPLLVPHLRAFLVTRPTAGPLIPNYRDPARHLDPKYAAHLLAVAMRPVVGDSGHALRHTAAQQLRRLTRDPYVVKEALRHATLDQQSSYVGTDVDLLAAALAQLPDPLQGPAR